MNKGIFSRNEKYFLSQAEKDAVKKYLQLEIQEKNFEVTDVIQARYLGLAYQMGIGVEVSRERAAFYYKIGKDKNDADSWFLYNMMQIEDRQTVLEEIQEEMNLLAENGSVFAMVYWGEVLQDGLYNMKPDKKQAYIWWKKAAELNHAEAQYYMAYVLRMGEVVEKDYAAAFQYALASSEQGFPRAFRVLGVMYRKGEYVNQDINLAKMYLQEALQAGDYFSVNLLGHLAYEAKDYDEAFRLYKLAALYSYTSKSETGSGYFNLGRCYEYGKGTEINVRRAIKLYLKAAARKNQSALKHTVDVIEQSVYAHSSDVDSNKIITREEQILNYERASQLNCERAEACLGNHYLFYAQHISLLNAKKWFMLGADKGCLECIESLLGLYSQAMGIKKIHNRYLALEYFRRFFLLIEQEDKNQIDAKKIQAYCYAYAIELAMAEEGKKTHEAESISYFRKCLESLNGVEFWHKIAEIAKDYVDKKAILDLLYDFLEKYVQYAKENNRDIVDDLLIFSETCRLLPEENKQEEKYEEMIRHTEEYIQQMKEEDAFNKNSNTTVKNSQTDREKAWAELEQVLRHCKFVIRSRIPDKFMRFLRKNKDPLWHADMDFSLPLDEMELLERTKFYISLVYRDFICSEEKRKELLEKERKELAAKGGESEVQSLRDIFI